MRRAFSLPIVIVLVTLIATPLLAFAFFARSTQNPTVKGVSTKNLGAQKGITLQISSISGTWDLYEYLCTSKESCLSSLDAGNRLQTLSGGASEDHEIVIDYSDEMKNYAFLKVYVKSSWGSQGRRFSLQDSGLIAPADYATLKLADTTVDVVLIPVKELSSENSKVIYFSDQ